MESLQRLLEKMSALGASTFLAKRLANNDNSKNQIYLGEGFAALNIIPHGEIKVDGTDRGGSVRDRAKASVKFYWIGDEGSFLAPNAQLILYPEYPEVRMSGFLLGCKNPPSKVMSVRDPGRVLVIGISEGGDVFGFAAPAGHPVANEILGRDDFPRLGVFLELAAPGKSDDARAALISELTRIYRLGWLASSRLNSAGHIQSYSAKNGGGYTLEAQLGIIPNAVADSDFLGWEIKQFGVRDFSSYVAKNPVTLMTPEPTGGEYRSEGASEFVRRYGYPDRKGIPDRLNFGGKYLCGAPHHPATGLALRVIGYTEGGGISDIAGCIALVDSKEDVVAEWSFSGLMKHWNRKHARAAYVPSIGRAPPPEYRFGSRIELYVKTDFILFLKQLSLGQIYYDPGIKLEGATGGRPKVKARSQFRISHHQLSSLYEQAEVVELAE